MSGKREPISLVWKKHKYKYLMIAPFALIFIVFTLLPVLVAIFLSFTNFNMVKAPEFAGLDNYVKLMVHITGPVSYLMCFLFAWMVNDLPRIPRAVMTLVFYAPSISGNAYLVWKLLFSSDSYGWVNAWLMKLGVIQEAVTWLVKKEYIMPILIIVQLWLSLGVSFLTFIAGFQNLDKSQLEAGSLEEAELIKLYCNTYRDMTFAIGNAFCMAAQEFQVDGDLAITHANYGYARSNIAKPGFVAGPCLEKDAYILINNMPDCASKEFILSARRFNESLEDLVVGWVQEHAGKPDGKKTIALSGMAFKGQPETSDLRGSSAVYIARKLHKAGYRLRLHDFVARREELEALGLGECFEDLGVACTGANLLLVLNNHKNYASLADGSAFSGAAQGFMVLDAWGACTGLSGCGEAEVATLGSMFTKKGEKEEEQVL